MFREGDWKIVRANDEDWELYDMENDLTELNNLAKEKPEIVDQVLVNYDKWKASLPE
jgi:arylsulfatase